ncbi:MAG TPA: flagellar motor protein MotB [Desulfotignum sp.]|nr:flagellar motor protein MotB [Desulfotignum sp.]
MRDTQYHNNFITYDDEATWLVTYADMMTLLLVFFILLYTLSSFEKQQVEAAMETVKNELQQDRDPEDIMALLEFSRVSDQKISIEDVTGITLRKKSLFKDMNRLIDTVDQASHVDTYALGGKIILRVSGEVLFASGSAVLKPGALPLFDRMVTVFEDYPDFTINIKGHTDDVPISTQAFPSNWELSAIRATTVLKYLVSKGIRPQRLTATGYGDIMPLKPNTTDANRAANRRVEFVLEKSQAEI